MVVEPGAGRDMYHAEPTAAASTMTMIMKGSDRFIFRVLNGSGQRCRQRTKDVAAIAGAEEIFAGAFRVRH